MKFRRFKNDFLTGLAAWEIKDTNEIYGLDDTILGNDDHLAEGLGAAAQRRLTKRLKQSFALIYNHTEDAILRRMLRSEAENNGRQAWTVLLRECDEPITELELENLKKNVRELTILGAVGYNDHSITEFRRALTNANDLIPDDEDRISEHELCLIMLHAIGSAAAPLAVATAEELKARPDERRFVYDEDHEHAGERNLTEIVLHFAPLWKRRTVHACDVKIKCN